jgi:hypothetical protein
MRLRRWIEQRTARVHFTHRELDDDRDGCLDGIGLLRDHARTSNVTEWHQTKRGRRQTNLPAPRIGPKSGLFV